MSGVWGGWMRRLRRGQTAGVEAPAVAVDAQPLDGAVIEPHDMSSAQVTGGNPGGATPALGAELDGNVVGEELETEEYLPDNDDVFDFAPASATARVAPAAAPAPTVAAPLLLQRGRFAACQAAIEAGADTGLAPFVETLTEGEALLRGLGLNAGESETRSMMLAPSPHARAMLVVFGEDGGGFFLSPLLAEQQSHTLYIRDEKRCLAMLGVDGLGEDYDACLLGILWIARALGAADLFCLGGGAACYSALRYGLDLGAAGVLAAGTLDHVRRGVQAPGLRPGTQARRLMRLAADLGPSMPDTYETAATRPSLVLCRPGQGALSRLAALPGTVNVDAPPGASAKILEWAEQSGQWRGMVRDLLTRRAVE